MNKLTFYKLHHKNSWITKSFVFLILTVATFFASINVKALTPQYACQRINTYNNLHLGNSANYWDVINLKDYYLDYYADAKYYNTIKELTSWTANYGQMFSVTESISKTVSISTTVSEEMNISIPLEAASIGGKMNKSTTISVSYTVSTSSTNTYDLSQFSENYDYRIAYMGRFYTGEADRYIWKIFRGWVKESGKHEFVMYEKNFGKVLELQRRAR
jgi:hypothetical protein